MNIVVVGGGKVGHYLTKEFIDHGHKPTIVELRKNKCINIANDLDIQVICGDGTIEDVLSSAGASNADAVVAVTGRDEDNLICCQVCKNKFNVKKTIARVNNPKNEKTLKLLGVDIAISSTTALTHIIERETDNSSIKRLISINNGEASINEIEINNSFKHINKKLKDIPVPNGVIIATINRNGNIIIPNGETEIIENDRAIVIAHNKVIHQMRDLFIAH